MNIKRRKRYEKENFDPLFSGCGCGFDCGDCHCKTLSPKGIGGIPGKLLELSCTVARESVDGAEKRDLTDVQKEALLKKLETVQAVRRGTSDGKIGPYDQYVYRFSFENQQEILMDDRGTLYTQRGGYAMTGDISCVLDLLNSWF